MIKVNLLKKKNVAGGGATEGMGDGLSKIKMGFEKLGITWEDVKELPLRTIAFCIVTVLVANDRVEVLKQTKLEEFNKKLESMIKVENELTAELGKTKDYDEQRKQLEGDEATLRGKIDAIQKLVSDRNLLYNTLVSLASTIPNDVWLQSLEVKSENVGFRGSSLDINQISDFMRRLGETPYFKDVSLKSTNQARESGIDIATFDLSAKRR